MLPLSTRNYRTDRADGEEPAGRNGVRHDDEFQRLPLRFHTQRGGDTDYRHHSGHPRGIFLLAGPEEYAHPSISIIVSLVGTFACLVAAGFSLNILTLFALVLAIGTVVDDAIVVVEAVQSKFDAGYKSPYLATKDAMGDVTMAIVSCTCVFMAVFIPVTFMGGTSGVFYTQFGITMATAVGISMISALTLCPAFVRHHDASVGRNQECQEHQRTGTCSLQCFVQCRAGQV